MSVYDGMNLSGLGALNNPIFAPQTQIQEVDGLNEVMSLNMGPNSSLLALDKTKPILWVIRTDQNRNKIDTLQFDITPHVPEPDPVVKGLEDRVGNMEQKLGEIAETMKRFEELMK